MFGISNRPKRLVVPVQERQMKKCDKKGLRRNIDEAVIALRLVLQLERVPFAAAGTDWTSNTDDDCETG